MKNKFNWILLFSIFLISSAYGYDYWDYYGSGRDHPLSAYIDRATYIGPRDYASTIPYYIDGPFTISSNTTPALTPQLTQMTTLSQVPLVRPSDQMVVNIPNRHGGYNAVVIRKSGYGFVGPDGEYYPEFPKIFQLQMKYGN